jgi:tetratricopeptide (TPR) repeat protein
MRPLLLAAVLLASAAPLAATDLLAEARRLYNLGQYDDAERVARDAAANVALVDRARVVLGRIHLERYRRSADPADLASARTALRAADTRALDARERLELTIGLAEALYLEDRFGAAAELFESALEHAGSLGPAAHDRVLDWWATALDRLAQRQQQEKERAAVYGRIVTRMGRELQQDPGSSPGGYWLSAGLRGCGELDRALDAALAGWVRAIHARDRGAAVRADLDRLVIQAILPERAARLPSREQKAALAGMLGEWEAFKEQWSR